MYVLNLDRIKTQDTRRISIYDAKSGDHIEKIHRVPTQYSLQY